jgi:hypothetical protein
MKLSDALTIGFLILAMLAMLANMSHRISKLESYHEEQENHLH